MTPIVSEDEDIDPTADYGHNEADNAEVTGLRDAQEGYVDTEDARTIVAHARETDGVIQIPLVGQTGYFATADYTNNRGVDVKQWVGISYGLAPRPGRALLGIPEVIGSGAPFDCRLVTDPVLVAILAGCRDVVVLSRANSPFEGRFIGPFDAD